MDKKKTGNLIKEARVKKNYTQSELGDLLGVSNKAVSRWENGESFPDVGVLENLSAVLDVRIQDIITGDTGINDESIVAEVVRVLKLQQIEKKRKAIRNGAFIVAMLCCIVSGYSALGNNRVLFDSDSIFVYMFLMVCSFALIVVGCTSQRETDKNDTGKFCKCMKMVSLSSLVWSILMTWCVFLMIINGHIPIGIELSSLGSFINWQLIGVFLLNFVITVIYVKRDEAIHWGWFASIATIYMTVLYGDLLHRMSATAQDAIESLAIRTFVVLVAVGISLVVTKIIKARGNIQLK